MDDLPNEILYKIISFLYNKDLVRFSLTNTKYRQLVINDKRKNVIKINNINNERNKIFVTNK